jgi:TPR repeat protein
MDYIDSCPWCEEVLCDTFDSYAETGNLEAQYIVASYYLTHVLDDIDAATKRQMACEYMKKAAEQGHVGAIRFLRKRHFSDA